MDPRCFQTPGLESPTVAAANPRNSVLRELAGRLQYPHPSTNRDGSKENTMNRKTPSIVGAAVELALFLAIALLPALLYGGYAGVLLAGGIFGTPVQPTFAVRALIVFGMVMGVTGVGALFAVGGAVAGAAVGVLAETPAPRPPRSRRRPYARQPPGRVRGPTGLGASAREGLADSVSGRAMARRVRHWLRRRGDGPIRVRVFSGGRTRIRSRRAGDCSQYRRRAGWSRLLFRKGEPDHEDHQRRQRSAGRLLPLEEQLGNLPHRAATARSCPAPPPSTT